MAPVRWLGVVLAIATPASAEVVAVEDASMATRTVVTIAAPPARVWATLIAPAQWWDSAHSWSGSAANLSLQARAGGCFCEKLQGGGGVEHLRVVHVAPSSLLRMVGALGPLQGDPVTGVLDFSLKQNGASTLVTVSYHLSGRRAGGFRPIAAAVDIAYNVMADGITGGHFANGRRLQNYILGALANYAG